MTNHSTDGSVERVAYELMVKIASEDRGKRQNLPPREYYFTLFAECLQIVSGEDPADVLEEATNGERSK